MFVDISGLGLFVERAQSWFNPNAINLNFKFVMFNDFMLSLKCFVVFCGQAGQGCDDRKDAITFCVQIDR